jgi:hypothetical protein
MLVLRDWAIRVLGGRGHGISADLWEAVPVTPHHVWGTFLGLERCAHPLAERLAGWRRGHDTPVTRAAGQLASAATAELQRSMSAARQLRAIGAIAQRERWPCVVLKGGVPAAHGVGFLDLHDVDVLVRAEHASSAVAALERAGYAAAPVAGRPYHLPPRTAASSLPVEVHTSLSRDGSLPPGDLWERLVPIPATPGAFGLPAGDHLWHVLTHAVIDHPHRVSRLRDALLVAQALSLCSPSDEAIVCGRIEAHPDRARLTAALALARVVGGTSTSTVDPLQAVAAADYLASIVGQHRFCPSEMREILILATATVNAGGRHRRKLWNGSMSREGGAPHALVSWLERPLPRLGARLRIGLRLARLAVAMPLAGALVRIANAEAARTLRTRAESGVTPIARE